jgi:hypothetical protein
MAIESGDRGLQRLDGLANALGTADVPGVLALLLRQGAYSRTLTPLARMVCGMLLGLGAKGNTRPRALA